MRKQPMRFKDLVVGLLFIADIPPIWNPFAGYSEFWLLNSDYLSSNIL